MFQMQRTSVIQPTTAVETVVRQVDDVNESAVWIVFGKMLFFTLLMTIAPLGSFFIAKDYVFEGIFHISSHSSYTYSAIVAVIVVHIVLITFLFVAFREDIPFTKKSTVITTKESTGKKD
jgi:NADH:ubiquinone oxidoreductase subunit 5 (subunit L)/multisubunit Na+/H+ antiporter MnhA subunit